MSRITVLHVDPDLETLAILSALLEHHGYRVASATNLSDGLRLASELRPGVVVSELEVPAHGGTCIPEALRAAGYRGKMIVWTANAFPDARAQAEGAGAIYRVKPALPGEIVDEVGRLSTRTAAGRLLR